MPRERALSHRTVKNRRNIPEVQFHLLLLNGKRKETNFIVRFDRSNRIPYRRSPGTWVQSQLNI